MLPIQRFIVAGSLVLASPALGQLVNVDMTWTGSTFYDSAGNYDYPDIPDNGIVNVSLADFEFRDNASATWRINGGALVILKQDISGSGHRFFVGQADGASAGTAGTLTITSDTGLPGTVTARGNGFAAMRIGHSDGGNSSSGILNIDGGVTMQTGWVYGEGSGTRELNVIDGEIDVFSDNSSKRLNDIDITLGMAGRLWIEDSTAAVTDLASFQSFVSGATLTAGSGTLDFTNNVERTSADTMNDVTGTLIAIDNITDTDNDGLPNTWEILHSLNPDDDGTIDPSNGASGDPDSDGLPNAEEFALGSNPQVNESGYAWQPRPDKVRLMVVNAHPDDEAIFFGGVLPYYTQVRQLPTVSICLTSGDFEMAPSIREAEFRNAAWIYGLRYQPHFPRFKDYWTETLDETWDVWADGVLDGNGITEGRVLAGNTLATYIRRYRPDVVVTHDFAGEYGHQNHQATAWATADAVTIAADSGTDLDGLPGWQVKKFYVHLYNGGTSPRLFHDFWEDLSIDTDGNGTPDMTPREVADMGLDQHLSQVVPDDLDVSSIYNTGEPFSSYHCEWWGLYSSTVGDDTVVSDFTIPGDTTGTTYAGWARGDFFEHLTAFPDTDADELPDAWELDHFATLAAAEPGADDDKDGNDSLYEFVTGLDPNVGDSLDFALSASTGTIDFAVPAAAGPGYAGLTRFYQLRHSSDLTTWADVPGVAGTGDGSTVSYPIPAGGSGLFYRLAIRIE